MRSKRSIWKRGLAVCLMAVLGFMFSATPLYQSQVQAAEANAGKEYIKELRLFITQKNNSLNEAEKWCAEQGNGWQVFEGEDPQGKVASKIATNLNIGTEGPGSINSCAVYLCYRTTTDPKEAVTDIAVMNEKGSYSEGAYERILKEQKDKYKDMVDNMKTMLTEYRTNYNNKVPTAVTAHNYLNAYKEDDSGKLLGDLLLDISDADLTEVLLQANGRIVIFIEQQLAAACDTGKTTFLDRMTKLGGYDGLRKKFLTAYNNDATKADRALKENYAVQANVIYESWNDVHDHFDNVKQKMQKYGVSTMTKEQYNQWLLDNANDPQIFAMKEEFDLIIALAGFKYGNGTLMDYFAKPQSDFQGDNMKELYPIVACLSKGQFAGLSECVSLFSILADSLGAALKNDYKTGESAKLLANATSEEKQIVEDAKKELEKNEEEVAKQEPCSVYEGVDREIFKGGVAVTTTAENFSNGNEKKWAEEFVESGQYKKWAIGMGVASAGSLVLAGLFWIAENASLRNGVYDLWFDVKNGVEQAVKEVGKDTRDWVKTAYNSSSWKSLNMAYELGDEQTVERVNQMIDITRDKSSAYYNSAVNVYKYLKIGFTVVGVLLAAADITMSVVALYKYYNRDHLPIPHHMVDLSYNENKETSYIVYKSVLDNNGKYGDLNGDCGKQWLALYATYDADAGTPILAPGDGQFDMFVQRGSADNKATGYSPLHMFGTPNVAQNITFCDGENGYSFDDEYNGTYLFFRHDGSEVTSTQTSTQTGATSEGGDEDGSDAVSGSAAELNQTGTAISGGVLALGIIGGLAVGGFAGFLIADTRRKKMNVKNDAKN